MTSSVSVSVRKRGRPKTSGTPRNFGIRLHDDVVSGLDTFIASLSGPKPSRSEAIRALVRESLTGLGYLKHCDDPERAN